MSVACHFLSMLADLISSGFVAALIKKLIVTQTDCSQYFISIFLVGFFLYFILFFSAPLIALFLRLHMIPITSRAGIHVVFNSLTVVNVLY